MSVRPLLLLAAAALAGAGCVLPGPELPATPGVAASSSTAPDVRVLRLADDGLQIEFSTDAAFDFGTARLRPAFEQQLVQLAALLMHTGEGEIVITGHTDNVGATDFNQALSEQRARRVASFLVDQGVAAQRLDTVGRGAQDPRATNATAAGRASNRRIELRVSPNPGTAQ